MLYVFDSVQSSMIRASFPDFDGLYEKCACGYRTSLGPETHADQMHMETCLKAPVWRWEPLPIARTNGEIYGLLKGLVHFYHAFPTQRSLRCSFCADAPNSPAHVRCEANWPVGKIVSEDMGEPNMNSKGCWEVAMGTDEPYCEYHWLDLK